VLNHIVEQHDLVLAIGVKFSHNASFGFGLRIAPEKLVHVDASRAVLDANYPAQFSICADAGEFCSRLEQKLDFATTSSLSDVEAWQEQLDESRDDSALEPNFSGCPGGSAAAFFGALQSHFPPDAMYVSDSGYHQMLLRRYMIASDSPQLLVPSNFQSMGFGLPAAIGAALEYPNRIVVCIHGDGGFQMCATDLATAVQLRLNMRVFVFDDGYYGLIRKQQLGSGDIANGIKVPAMDLLAVARATGADFVDTSNTGIEDTLKSLDNVDGPVLVRQVLSESAAQAKFYARKQMKGRIRRFIGSDAMDFLRRYRK
jgi:acetolactate synthase-1/2/3 large subunit